MMIVYNYMSKVPRWILLLGSGTLASFLLGLMHSEKPQTNKLPPSQKPETIVKEEPVSPTVPSASTTATKSGGAKHRKGKK
jgi:hypothetical protein